MNSPNGDPNAAAGRAANSCLRLYARGLRLLFNQTPGALWTIDRELKLTAVIGRETGIFGVPAERLVGTSIPQFVGTDDPSNPAIAHHLSVLAGRSASFRYELKDNVYEVRIEPIQNNGGGVVGAIGVALNVTAEHRAVEEMTRSRARLAEAQALAHVGSWEWSMRDNRVAWSEELYRIYGVAPDAFGGTLESYLGLVHPDDLDATKAVLFEALQRKGSFAYSHRIKRPDGETRILETRGEVVDEQQGATRLVGSCWDVTEQWKAKADLERTASVLKATLEATPGGLMVVDSGGKLVAYNQKFLSMWGIPDRIAARRNDDELLEMVTPQVDDPEAFLRRVHELYATPEVDSFDVVRFKDGRVFERQSIPQRIGAEIAGRVWSFHDVTDRERVLREAQFLADAGSLLESLDVEKALEGVARLSVPMMGEACAVDLLSDVGGTRRLLLIERDGAIPIRGDIPRAVLAGRPLIYSIASVSYMSLPLPGRGTLYGVLTFAAADRKYVDRDLALADELASRVSVAIENAQLYQGAQEALRIREEFLSIAAHEIRGPITSIHLAVQTLRRDPTAARAGKLLDAIEREDRQLIRLVDELLDVTRIRSGRIHFDLERVDLAEVLRDVAARLAPDLTRSGCTLSISSPGELFGMWDRMRIDQVVTNLISNAIKFGQGKPIEVEAASDRGKVRLAVRDHGIGIDPRMQDRIFDPFARAVSARHYGGLGLGLYIVRTIVLGLGGSVRAEGAAGGGSVFTVELPQEGAA
jgi:PAS domain S-box-containing protein